MQFESTQLIVTSVSLVILSAFFFSLYRASRKNQSMQPGELITFLLIKRSWDGTMISIILIGIFEALTASSIQVVGEPEINTFIRLCAHGVVTYLYTMAGVNLPIQFYRLILSIKDKKEAATVISKFVLVVGFMAVALIFPLFNLFTVASACKQHADLMLLFKEWTAAGDTMREYYLSIGLPADYSPWGHLFQIVQINAVMTCFIHPFLIALDGFFTFANGGKTIRDLAAEVAPKLDGKDKKDAANKAKADNADVNDPLDAKAKAKATADKDNESCVQLIEDILAFYGPPFTDESRRKAKATALAKQSYEKYYKANEISKIESLLSMLGTLVVSVEGLKGKSNPTAKETADLKKEIQTKFKARPSDGGFGEDLPNPKP